MVDFFFNYGLFTAKVLTFFIILVASVVIILMMVANRARETEAIEIEKINDKYDTLKEALESELLTKEEQKMLKKEKKKEDKAEEKRNKKRIKAGKNEPLKPRIFVLKFSGDISASEVDNLREEITAVLLVAKSSDEVVVILESSGGLVHTYGLAASQLQRIRNRNIPLTVSIDLVAASGGYLMASVANTILAAPFAVVGSIGVLAQIPNFNRVLKKHDIDIEQHTAGEYKTTLTMLGENTDRAREKFKEELEDTHTLFKQFVSENRPLLDIEQLATGEHWYGTQAIDLKLVDELITSDDYLLQKSETADIFEVNYVINLPLSEKLISILQNMKMHLSKLVFNTPFFQTRLQA